jgi:hypothetical protein
MSRIVSKFRCRLAAKRVFFADFFRCRYAWNSWSTYCSYLIFPDGGGSK